ncbi:unnamed protein product, partial [Discosporangium mesarthrocarpum]
GSRLGRGTPRLNWACLEQLRVSQCGLTSLDASLRLLPRVFRVDLSRNALGQVEFFQDCKGLQDLNLGHNLIRSVSGINRVLGNLVSLNLRDNMVSDTSGLERLYSLRRLDLSFNRLSGLEQVARLSVLPCLQELGLRGNPLGAREGRRYRITTLSLLLVGRGAELQRASDSTESFAQSMPGEGLGLKGGGLVLLDGEPPSKKEIAELARLIFDRVEKPVLTVSADLMTTTSASTTTVTLSGVAQADHSGVPSTATGHNSFHPALQQPPLDGEAVSEALPPVMLAGQASTLMANVDVNAPGTPRAMGVRAPELSTAPPSSPPLSAPATTLEATSTEAGLASGAAARVGVQGNGLRGPPLAPGDSSTLPSGGEVGGVPAAGGRRRQRRRARRVAAILE